MVKDQARLGLLRMNTGLRDQGESLAVVVESLTSIDGCRTSPLWETTTTDMDCRDGQLAFSQNPILDRCSGCNVDVDVVG